MSQQVTVTAFTFDELSDKAKEKAREWYREGSCDDNYWSECAIEEAVREGELMGIAFKTRARKSMSGKELTPKPCIFWSGFWSQGDGACFEGTWRASDVKADKVADGWGEDPATTEIKRIAAEFDRIARLDTASSFKVEHRGHYSHEHCTEFDVTITDDESYDPVSPDPEGEKAEADLIEAARDFMRWIYRVLEAAYNDANSDEQVDETILANEFWFDIDGSRCKYCE